MNKIIMVLFFVLFSISTCFAQEMVADTEKKLSYNYVDTDYVAINLSIIEPISTKKKYL